MPTRTEIKREYRPSGSLSRTFYRVEYDTGKVDQLERWYSCAGVLFNSMRYPLDSDYARKRLGKSLF